MSAPVPTPRVSDRRLRQYIEDCSDEAPRLLATYLDLRDARAALAAAVQAEREACRAAQAPLMADLEEYFDQRADVDCVGDPQRYVGNTEKHLLDRIRSRGEVTP
jgi:hypothetical protein